MRGSDRATKVPTKTSCGLSWARPPYHTDLAHFPAEFQARCLCVLRSGRGCLPAAAPRLDRWQVKRLHNKRTRWLVGVRAPVPLAHALSIAEAECGPHRCIVAGGVKELMRHSLPSANVTGVCAALHNLFCQRCGAKVADERIKRA